MKKSHFLATTMSFFMIVNIFAQDFQGQAYYESKTSVDMDFEGREMTPEMKKRIQERMKTMLEKTYILTFNKNESTYKEEEKLEAPGQGGGFRMMGNFTAGVQYKNIKDNNILQEQEFFGKQFLINDTLPKYQWKMTGETKTIGEYTCYKATSVRKVDEFDFRSMRPRPQRDKKEESDKKEKENSIDKPESTETTKLTDLIELPKEVTVTAWYTPQVPVSQGPGEYYGLPGLILEVNADRTTILCSKLILNPEEQQEIKVPSKGKAVSREEYNDIMKKKMEEMREMFEGDRRRDGGRRMMIRG